MHDVYAIFSSHASMKHRYFTVYSSTEISVEEDPPPPAAQATSSREPSRVTKDQSIVVCSTVHPSTHFQGYECNCQQQTIPVRSILHPSSRFLVQHSAAQNLWRNC